MGTAGHKVADVERRIRLRAYAMWEAEGRPDGRHEQHWQGAVSEAADHDDTPGRIDPDRAADAAPGPMVEGAVMTPRQERLLDQALEKSFPGSDPIAPKRMT